MSLEKIQALIIRVSDWSESSRISTIFSREFGKIKGLAKGGRRIRSPFDNALDLLTYSSMVLLQKHRGGLDLVTEAQVLDRFPGLAKCIYALHAGYYIAELLDAWTEENDPHPVMFDEAIQTLGNLSIVGTEGQDKEKQASLISALLMRFEFLMLVELGFKPELDFCTGCGKSVDKSMVFSPDGGGVKCRGCALGDRSAFRTAVAIVENVKKLYSPDIKAVIALDLPMRKELRKLLNRYVTYLLGKRLKLQSYLETGGI